MKNNAAIIQLTRHLNGKAWFGDLELVEKTIGSLLFAIKMTFEKMASDVSPIVGQGV